VAARPGSPRHSACTQNKNDIDFLSVNYIGNR
jgi:hypothetical protein